MGRGASCFPIGGSGRGTASDIIMPGVGRVNSLPLPGDDLLGSFTEETTHPTAQSQPRDTMVAEVLGFRTGDRGNIVREVYLEDTCGFELPMVRVTLNNVDKQFSSADFTKEQTQFNVTLGYTNPGTEVYGPFVVQRPKFKFQSSNLTIEVVAFGEAVKLGATERREVYKKMKDSDIARRIAARYGFVAAVDDTGFVHEQHIQANESDYHFLSRLAKLYGYMLYVDRGVLHFHKIRTRTSGYRLTYLEPGQNNVSDFVVHSRTFMRGLKLQMSQIDPVTKEEFTVNSSEDPDAVQSVTDYRNWKDLVSIPGIGQPQRFITNEGHEQQRPLLKNQIDWMAKSTRYVISGIGHCFGLERLRARDLIEINGIGRNSGKYFVSKVVHVMSAEKAYRVQFEVVRTGAGETSSVNQPVETTPQSAGVVRL